VWFKNLQLFTLKDVTALSPQTLQDALKSILARSCSATEMFSFGWTAPIDADSESLVASIPGFMAIRARRYERILPGSVIQQVLQERIATIESKDNRTVYRKEKMRLKDDITQELLPRAFIRAIDTHAFLDIEQKLLIINTASRTRAEALVSLLRKCLGSLKLSPVSVQMRPQTAMSEWLAHNTRLPDFILEDECELIDAKQGEGVVRCRRQDVLCQEIQNHIHAGKEVTQLAMTFQARISFVITADLIIKRVNFLDIIKEQRQNISAENIIEHYEADFTLFTAEISIFVQNLFALFGGLALADTPKSLINSGVFS
jgi:recombination associated protein RdgC